MSAKRPATRTVERLPAAAILLLALVLQLRGLRIAFPNQDLVWLDVVLRTRLGALLRGAVLPGDFTPLSREIWLWWWSRSVGLDALGFHLIAAGLLVASLWTAWRLGERWGGAGAGWIAAGLLLAFPPLGAAMASALAARDLLAVLACGLSLWLYSSQRHVAAGLVAGLAVATRETAALLPAALLVLDLRQTPADTAAARARRLAPAFLAATVVLGWIFSTSPWKLAVAPGAVLGGFVSAWAPPGTRLGLGDGLRSAPWLLPLVAVLSFLAVPTRPARPKPPLREAAMPGVIWLALALAPAILFGVPREAGLYLVPALGLALAAGGALARQSPWVARGAMWDPLESTCRHASLSIL